ncbi:hypothetical protein HA402_004531 [Bradysia odoriphaga]|nr:hypothetical protein HA402_004531 [Bradysia odoriphaga]
MPEINEYGQPVGDAVPDWKPRPSPAPVTLNGRSCRLEPLNTNKHADDLYAAFSHDDGRLWTYMAEGPFPNIEEFRKFIETEVCNDFQDFAVVDLATVKPVGMIALKQPDPQNGVVEGGRAVFSPLLQQSILSTEAQFLLASYVFDHLGYRRYKWRCGSHNAAARKAVERIGFKLDGVFCKAKVQKGRSFDEAWFSITDDRWPAIKSALQTWLSLDNFDAQGRQIRKLEDIRRSIDRKINGIPSLL